MKLCGGRLKSKFVFLLIRYFKAYLTQDEPTAHCLPKIKLQNYQAHKGEPLQKANFFIQANSIQ